MARPNSMLLVALICTACGRAPTAPTPPPTPTAAPVVVAAPVTPPPLLLCFGSSITAGYAGTYVPLVQTAFGHQLAIENDATNGEGLVYGEPKIYAAVETQHPTFLLVEYAVNDAISAPPLVDFEMMYRRMIARVQAAGVTRVFLLTTGPAAGRPNLETYDDLYRRLAQEIPGVVLIDTYPAWAALSPADFARYVPDQVHPTTEGWAAVGRDLIVAQIRGQL